jgi:hypothetical protein
LNLTTIQNHEMSMIKESINSWMNINHANSMLLLKINYSHETDLRALLCGRFSSLEAII